MLLICLIIISMVIIPCYAENIDLSGMTLNELIALKDQINLAIWNSNEWQEVTVPQGEWVVGEDIPAGTWTVKCADINQTNYMMKECDLTITSDEDTNWVIVYNPNHQDYAAGEVTEVKLDLKEGMTVIINISYAPAVFTPYAGKPSLGFK